MELDRRRGGGYWTGCHQFHDIICDGADIHEPRVGGLRMGGTYWYFVSRLVNQLDDACELTP